MMSVLQELIGGSHYKWLSYQVIVIEVYWDHPGKPEFGELSLELWQEFASQFGK